jgi:hypothetical protein
MLKRTLFVAVPLLVLLAGGYLLYHILVADNDSPIIISDTSTGPLDAKKPRTRIWHKAASGNHDEHFHKNADNHFFVHDKQDGNGPDLLAGCLVFASLPKPIGIPASAKTWEIFFEDAATTPLFSLLWVGEKTGNKEKGDITVIANGAENDTSDKKNVFLSVNVAKMRWQIDQGPISSPIDPYNTGLVTVHYCPGGLCTDKDGNDLCK